MKKNINTQGEYKTEINREDMTEDQERQFVKKCFEEFESSGFAETYWSPYTDYANRIGQKFSVMRRAAEKDADLCTLPFWIIKFEDGNEINAYPEEIIKSEIEAVKEQISAQII